jgi:hypothetical protein
VECEGLMTGAVSAGDARQLGLLRDLKRRR